MKDHDDWEEELADALRRVKTSSRLPTPRVRKAIREQSGLTQERFAKAIHIHRVTLARWETGVSEPRGDARIRYVEALDKLRQAVAT